ncbi:MAG TPA: N-acetyltransferase [Ignavibacteria bacterium]|nr:N-acetyltransferase [Ignavibacteria bacterium]
MSNNIEIKLVESESEKKKFIEFPYEFYKDYKNWVEPLRFDVQNNLNVKKNPFYQHSKLKLWLAKKDGKIVGRIAGIINSEHNDFYKDKTGFFGFFECINDKSVSKMLFDKAMEFAKENGMDTLRGPVNPSMNDECGLLIDGFDKPPVMLMPYNPEYYISLYEDYGLAKAKDLLAFWISKDVGKDEKMMSKLDRISEMIIKKENLVIRNVNMKDFANEVQKVREVYNNAWEENWGFVPMTVDEFKFIAANLKLAVDPAYVEFAEVNGVPVAFSLALPDVNQAIKGINGKLFPFGVFKFLKNKKKIDQLRVIIMGVKKEYQKKGIDAIFYRNIIKAANRKGIKGAEISWILEDNFAMKQTAEKLGAKVYKTYRMYDKTI